MLHGKTAKSASGDELSPEESEGAAGFDGVVGFEGPADPEGLAAPDGLAVGASAPPPV
ncbi:hypothetical protein [Streptomyces sp. NPDC001970]